MLYAVCIYLRRGGEEEVKEAGDLARIFKDGMEAAEERIQQHEQRADDHHELVVLAKQLGEQLAAGDKAAAGIYGKKYQNEHRRNGHDDLFLFVEAVGQKVRHSDGIACCKRVAAQRLCDDEPVEV